MAKTATKPKPSEMTFSELIEILSGTAASLGDDVSSLVSRFNDNRRFIDARTMARVYMAIKDVAEQMDEALKPLGKLNDALKTEYVPDAFQDEKVTTITFEDGSRVNVPDTPQVRCSISAKGAGWRVHSDTTEALRKLKLPPLPEGADLRLVDGEPVVVVPDASEGLGWLRANGLGDLIVTTVNAGTLASAVKEMIREENREPPEDLFNLFFQPTTSVTKGKKK